MRTVEDPVDAARRLAWLPARCRDGDPGWTGFDPGGWADSIWLLHAMFERPDIPPVTHQQLRLALDPDRPAVPLGLEELRRIFTHDVADVTDDQLQAVADACRLGGGPGGGVLVASAEGLVDTGIPLGYVRTPTAPHWRRLLWRDWSARGGRTLGDQIYPPSYSWFDESFPVGVRPPPEGSLDQLSWDRLLEVLSRHGRGPTSVNALYSEAAPSGARQERLVFGGSLLEAAGLVEGHGLTCTPSNLWPDDGSWFVYTDADLMATKVSGSAALIAALVDDVHLETLRWERPTAI